VFGGARWRGEKHGETRLGERGGGGGGGERERKEEREKRAREREREKERTRERENESWKECMQDRVGEERDRHTG